MKINPAKLFRGKKPLYKTAHGAAYLGDSLEFLKKIKPNSVNLVVSTRK